MHEQIYQRACSNKFILITLKEIFETNSYQTSKLIGLEEFHLKTDSISSSTMDPRIIFLLLLVFSGVFAMHHVDIPDDYVPSMRPLPKDEEKPLDMECVLILRNIVDISETKQQMTLEASLNFLWIDKNIKIKKNVTKYDGGEEKYIVMDSSYSEKIWIPDIFIDKSLDLRVPNFHTKSSRRFSGM